MRVLSRDDPDKWQRKVSCTLRSCRAKLLIESTDIRRGMFGSNYGGDSPEEEFYVECPECGTNLILKNLPSWITEPLRKGRTVNAEELAKSVAAIVSLDRLRGTNSTLSVRAMKGLRRLGIETLEQLVEKTEEELLLVRNVGPYTICEIREFLQRFGLKLKGIFNE